MSSNLPPHFPFDEELGGLRNTDKEAITKSVLLQNCPEEAVDDIAHLATLKFVPLSGILLQASEPNDSFYIVSEGQLASYRDAALTEIISRLPPGGCAGEMSFLAEDAGLTYVRAQWPARVLSIKIDALREIIKKYPQMAVNLLELMSLRAKELSLHGHHGAGLNFANVYNAVTGIYNRRWLLDVYKLELAKAVDMDKNVTLAIFDINRFFTVNQRLSRVSGDIILKQVGEIIRASIKLDDLCAHLSIDQFVVLFHDLSVAEAGRLSELICQTVSARLFSLPGGISARISLSAAVVSSHRQDIDQTLFRLLQGLAEVKKDVKRSVFIETELNE